MIGEIKVHAGDFREGKHHLFLPGRPGKPGKLLMKKPKKFFRERISTAEIEELDNASEESVKRLGGTAGWGAAGAMVLGPAGLLAGLLLGGKGKDVTFVCRFKDGRKFMATTDAKTHRQLVASIF
jgi:hypothetical protein